MNQYNQVETQNGEGRVHKRLEYCANIGFAVWSALVIFVTLFFYRQPVDFCEKHFEDILINITEYLFLLIISHCVLFLIKMVQLVASFWVYRWVKEALFLAHLFIMGIYVMLAIIAAYTLFLSNIKCINEQYNKAIYGIVIWIVSLFYIGVTCIYEIKYSLPLLS